jgi:hypothetical protein
VTKEDAKAHYAGVDGVCLVVRDDDFGSAHVCVS